MGVFHRDQARALGISDDAIHRWVSTGAVIRVYPRVFRDAASPVSWLQSLTAALLWAGSEAAASHRAAAALWELDGYVPGSIEITVPKALRAPPGIVVHRSQLSVGDITTVSGFKTTSPTRTLLDLAAFVDEEALEIALDCALRKGLTSVDHLTRRFAQTRSRGRRGYATVDRLLTQRSGLGRHLDSVLETKFLRLLRRERLPRPEPGVVVGRYRFDFAYPTIRLGIELDGYAHHGGRVNWDSDRKRSNELAGLGWTLLHFTWEDVTQSPRTVVAELRKHLYPTLLS